MVLDTWGKKIDVHSLTQMAPVGRDCLGVYWHPTFAKECVCMWVSSAAQPLLSHPGAVCTFTRATGPGEEEGSEDSGVEQGGGRIS